jgi:hypothetical protein
MQYNFPPYLIAFCFCSSDYNALFSVSSWVSFLRTSQTEWPGSNLCLRGNFNQSYPLYKHIKLQPLPLRKQTASPWQKSTGWCCLGKQFVREYANDSHTLGKMQRLLTLQWVQHSNHCASWVFERRNRDCDATLRALPILPSDQE